MKIHYDNNALLEAARYIFLNNPYCSSLSYCNSLWLNYATIDEVYADMKRHMIRVAKVNADHIRCGSADADWVTYCGTAGYFFIYSSDVDDSIDVQILVQPTFKHDYVEENLDGSTASPKLHAPVWS